MHQVRSLQKLVQAVRVDQKVVATSKHIRAQDSIVNALTSNARLQEIRGAGEQQANNSDSA